MISETDLAWFAGIIDGEGSLTLIRHANSSGAYRYAPDVQVCMTHERTIQRCVGILDDLGIDCGVSSRPYSPPRLPIYRFFFNRLNDVQTMCGAIRPYCTTKSAQVELLLEFCERRLSLHSLDSQGRVISRGRGTPPCGDRDHDIYHQFRVLHTKGSNRITA